MTWKASISGPNRKGHRSKYTKDCSRNDDDDSRNDDDDLFFHIQSLEEMFPDEKERNKLGIGDACIFDPRSAAGKVLIRRHEEMAGGDFHTNPNADPILIHFHEHPIFILRAVPLGEEISTTKENVLFLSKLAAHNHKVCVNSTLEVTCCSRPSPTSSDNYPILSRVAVQVHLRNKPKELPSFSAKDISRALTYHTFHSVLTLHETILVTVDSTDLVCHVTGMTLLDGGSSSLTMDDPYRGRVGISTDFFVSASDESSLHIQDSRILPSNVNAVDVVHITTSDLEWFPVPKTLLAPCIKLTKYVHAGRGKYSTGYIASVITPPTTLPMHQRSPDAPNPKEDPFSPHCQVPIDCCTFDRILLFLMHYHSPQTQSFTLSLSEINTLSKAAGALGLQPLEDLCRQRTSSFYSRVRSDAYISLSEVFQRNKEQKDILLILDGMVLDITNWINEHPGGATIIPTQGLNKDCVVFFEMYHVSQFSFLYLKNFYIGELDPEDRMRLQMEGGGTAFGSFFAIA